MTTRRGFLASLLALPVVARVVAEHLPRITHIEGWTSQDGAEPRNTFVCRIPDRVLLLRRNMKFYFKD